MSICFYLVKYSSSTLLVVSGLFTFFIFIPCGELYLCTMYTLKWIFIVCFIYNNKWVLSVSFPERDFEPNIKLIYIFIIQTSRNDALHCCIVVFRIEMLVNLMTRRRSLKTFPFVHFHQSQHDSLNCNLSWISRHFETWVTVPLIIIEILVKAPSS